MQENRRNRLEISQNIQEIYQNSRENPRKLVKPHRKPKEISQITRNLAENQRKLEKNSQKTPKY